MGFVIYNVTHIAVLGVAMFFFFRILRFVGDVEDYVHEKDVY